MCVSRTDRRREREIGKGKWMRERGTGNRVVVRKRGPPGGSGFRGVRPASLGTRFALKNQPPTTLTERRGTFSSVGSVLSVVIFVRVVRGYILPWRPYTGRLVERIPYDAAPPSGGV
ncbi:MAG: hypothetical protein MdMp014T_1679 [Treponematales bacterium]